jgi:hypothetical protein
MASKALVTGATGAADILKREPGPNLIRTPRLGRHDKDAGGRFGNGMTRASPRTTIEFQAPY